MKNTSFIKKFISIVSALIIPMSLTVGCGKNENGSNNGGNAGSSNADNIDIRLVLPCTAGQYHYEAYTAAIEKYMDENPNVNVTIEGLSSAELRTKLSVEFAANSGPDIGWAPLSYAREFINNGQIIDWSDVVSKDAELKGWFSDMIWENVTIDDQIVFCPQELSMDALFYNTEMFEQYGWKVPTTFDEMVALCDDIRAEGIAPIVAGGADSRFAWLASALLARSAGVENFKALTLGDQATGWDKAENGFVTAMEKFKELVDADAYYNGVLGLTTTDADAAFAKGEAAMYYEGAWKPTNFEAAGGKEFVDKLGRIDFPAMTDCPEGSPKYSVGGCVLGWFCSSGMSEAKQAACIDILKLICGPEMNKDLVENGCLLYAGDIEYDSSKLSDIINTLISDAKNVEGFVPPMDAIVPPPVDLAIKGTAMPGIISGEYSVEKAVAEVQKAAEEYASNNK